MKNKIFIALFALMSLFIVGCNTHSDFYIEEISEAYIFDYTEIKVYANGKEIKADELEWTLNNYDIAEIDNGKLFAKGYGDVIIGVVEKDNPSNYDFITIKIVNPAVTDIVISGENQVDLYENIQLEAKVYPEIIQTPVTWESSDTSIINVSNGLVHAVGVGSANVIAKCEDFEKSFEVTVLPIPTSIEITGKSEITIDEVSVFTFNIKDEVTLVAENNEIVEIIDNKIIGKKAGKTTITALKVSDNDVQGTIEITVKDISTQKGMSDEEKTIIQNILKTMTLEKKVGEMFNVGFTSTKSWYYGQNPGYSIPMDSSTGLPYATYSREISQTSVYEYIEGYPFGNFTITPYSGDNIETMMLAISKLNQFGYDNTGVNPYIMINYDEVSSMPAVGLVPSNMATGNTTVKGSVEGIYNLFSQRLNAMGVNAVLNEYVNYSGNNDSSNIYGDNAYSTIATAATINNIYKDNHVAFIPDMSVYSYYTDDRDQEILFANDFRYLEAAVKNGSSIISLPATVFYGLNSDDFIFNNKEIIDTYIRQEKGYEGVLMLDAEACETLFGWNEDLFVNNMISAINNGIDMISYNFTFTNSWSAERYANRDRIIFNLYKALVEGVQAGTITENRIDEAVTRILLSKIRNNVIDAVIPSDFDFEESSKNLVNIATNFITAYGNMHTIDFSKSTLFISGNNDKTGTTMSIGDNFSKYFKQLGYSNLKVRHTNTLIPDSILNEAEQYDYVYVCASGITNRTSIGVGNTANYVQFVRDLKAKNANVCIILPDDIESKEQFPFIENFICMYGAYNDDFENLFKVLSGEGTPSYKQS